MCTPVWVLQRDGASLLLILSGALLHLCSLRLHVWFDCSACNCFDYFTMVQHTVVLLDNSITAAD